MSRSKNILGLKSVKIGAIAVDGGMGTTLTEIFGATATGTASLMLNEGSYDRIEIEETDDAYDELMSAAPEWVFQMESYNVSAKALGDISAGTYTAGSSGAPDKVALGIPQEVERSVEIETRNGAKLEIPRMKLRIRPQFDFQKQQFGRVIITGTPLLPTKADTATITKTDAPSA